MKKNLFYIFIVIAIVILEVTFNKKEIKNPQLYYQVYLDDQVIGKIKEKKELEKYFVEQGKIIKDRIIKYEKELLKESDIDFAIEVFNSKQDIQKLKEYIEIEHPNINSEVNQIIKKSNNENLINNLTKEKLREEDKNYKQIYVNEFKIYKYSDEFYIPIGVEIKKIYSHNKEISTVEEIYNQIQTLKTTSIMAYRIAIKGEDRTQYVHTINRKIFEDALELTISTFVGKENYELYITDNQIEIKEVGSLIEDIYIEENITIKHMKCSVTEKIYTDAEDLSQYLLFGNKENSSIYTVKQGDSLEQVALSNKVSVEEIFMSNPEFTSVDNILAIGRKIIINELNPKLNVVVIKKVVEDQESNYDTIETIDDNRVIGDNEVTQVGVNGKDRLTLRVYAINGQEVNVETINKKVLVEPIPEKITIGKKLVSKVGTGRWKWPTAPGWHISTYFGWRYHPIGGYRQFHNAIDVYGPGYNSPIYAADNGTIIEARYHSSYGNYIVINHNNGYYTLYAHMTTLTKKVGNIVSRGTVIGYMGRTGTATGVHLHYEVWYGGPPYVGTARNPLSFRYS